MRRSSHRDPRSLLELRRLAYRAQRSPEAREVLHDALLETMPGSYEFAIQETDRLATSSRRGAVLWFFPNRLKNLLKGLSWSTFGYVAFETHACFDAASRKDLARFPRLTANDVRSAVIVYARRYG